MLTLTETVHWSTSYFAVANLKFSNLWPITLEDTQIRCNNSNHIEPQIFPSDLSTIAFIHLRSNGGTVSVGSLSKRLHLFLRIDDDYLLHEGMKTFAYLNRAHLLVHMPIFAVTSPSSAVNASHMLTDLDLELRHPLTCKHRKVSEHDKGNPLNTASTICLLRFKPNTMTPLSLYRLTTLMCLASYTLRHYFPSSPLSFSVTSSCVLLCSTTSSVTLWSDFQHTLMQPSPAHLHGLCSSLVTDTFIYPNQPDCSWNSVWVQTLSP